MADFPFELATQGLGAIAGLAQTLIASRKEKRANEKMDRLFSRRKAFKTPEEVFKILNLAENNLQGFSDSTMEFLTGQADVGLAAGLGSATRLGADPNQLGGLVDSYYQNIFATGAQSELAKMKQFDSLTNALMVLSQNKEAEWASEDSLIKDQLQATGSQVRGFTMDRQSGLNLLTNSVANAAAYDLYNTGGTRRRTPKAAAGTTVIPTGYGGGGITPSEILARRNEYP